MSKDKLTDYDNVAANNTDCGGINLSEGVMVPSDLNNFAREIMSHLADFADGTTGVDVLTLQDDDASASIKLQAPSEVTTTTTFTLPDGDGTNGQVLNTDGSGQLGWSSAFSSGMLVPYAGGSAPSGWLLCYGQAVSRTTYAALFSAIGTVYGGGDGSTTFNLPDLRGRVIAGQDDMGGTSADRLTSAGANVTANVNGATSSSTSVTLDGNSGTIEVGMVVTGSGISGTVTVAAVASQTSITLSSAQTLADDAALTFGMNGDVLGAAGGSETHTLTEAELAAHSHSLGTNGRVQVGNDNGEAYSGKWVSGSGSTITYSTQETGSDTAHNNVQPTIVLNYIIKT